MPTRRQSRVAEQIHRDLSTLLLFEVHDPRLARISITDVRVTPDLLLARIYYTVLPALGSPGPTLPGPSAGAGGSPEQEGGPGDEEAEARAALEHAKGYLRTQLAGQLGLRSAPDLVFHRDTSAEVGRRIDELLDSLQRDERSADEPGPDPS